MLEHDADAPVFAISVAAQLSGLHPQTLRQYDRLGLVSPGRTGGRSRLYSLRDIARLREVVHLAEAGVNLEGIRRIMELRAENESLRARLAEVERDVRSTALVLWRGRRR
ncbi:MAG: helix-turn-helix transcriptional regulator [Actinomycetales bacterium]|nr:helix-turn-helix transcriptional regulator [Actinomycetales bacterium]